MRHGRLKNRTLCRQSHEIASMEKDFATGVPINISLKKVLVFLTTKLISSKLLVCVAFNFPRISYPQNCLS